MVFCFADPKVDIYLGQFSFSSNTKKIKNECKNGYLAFIFISIITLPFNTFEEALKLSIIICQLFYRQIS